MKRQLARLATALLVAPLVLVAAAGTAAAEDIVTVPGCYGAGTAVVCDATLSAMVPYSVEVYETSVPVCAGTCTDVPVALVRVISTGNDPLVCATWTNEAGSPAGVCTDDVIVNPRILDTLRTLAANTVGLARDVVCGNQFILCGAAVELLLRTVEDTIRG